MPGRFELKPTLAKIWHAPDNFRIMEPLPPMHRRGIIIAAIVLVIGFLLPASETSDAPVVTREAQLICNRPPERLTKHKFRRNWSRRKTIRIRWRPLRRNPSRKVNRKNKANRQRSLSSRIAVSASNGAHTG